MCVCVCVLWRQLHQGREGDILLNFVLSCDQGDKVDDGGTKTKSTLT